MSNWADDKIYGYNSKTQKFTSVPGSGRSGRSSASTAKCTCLKRAKARSRSSTPGDRRRNAGCFCRGCARRDCGGRNCIRDSRLMTPASGRSSSASPATASKRSRPRSCRAPISTASSGVPIASKAGFEYSAGMKTFRRGQELDARADRAVHPGPERDGPRHRDDEAARSAHARGTRRPSRIFEEAALSAPARRLGGQGPCLPRTGAPAMVPPI